MCSKSASREVQAVEGKKLAETWGAMFMESSAQDNQVLNVKIALIGKANRVFLHSCLPQGWVVSALTQLIDH